MTRVSRKKVQDILTVISDKQTEYRLITHQMLGDRKDYWYQYSIIKDTYEIDKNYVTITRRGNRIDSEFIIKSVTLKEAYEKAIELLKDD